MRGPKAGVFRAPARLGLGFGLVAVLLSACGMADSGVRVVSNDDLSDATNTLGDDGSSLIADTGIDIPSGGFDDGFPLDRDKPTRDYDRFLMDAIFDIEQYWLDNYSNVYGGDYSLLAGGVHPAYPDRRSALPRGCEFSGDYAVVENNAFYCEEGDFIVYDDALLFPDFVDEFGPASIAVIMAHEWGHAIQSSFRHDIAYAFVSTTLELQADCFAGAWAGHVAKDGLNGYRFNQSDITGALLGLVQIGDAPGSTSYDASAHGSAFDRVSAFQDGFTGGPRSCADYEINEPTPLQFGFSPEELARANPSDFPFGREMFESMRIDLSLFWEALVDIGTPWTAPTLELIETDVAECADGDTVRVLDAVAWCPDANSVAVSLPVARQFYDLIPGDYAVAYLIGLGYAEAVQAAIGSDLGAPEHALLSDCLVGMWSSDILPFNQDPVVADTEETPRIVLSPGDLDEAIRTALILGDVENERSRGTPFEKVDAFRQGVLYGSDGCFAA
jgi:predicted metalloprotease